MRLVAGLALAGAVLGTLLDAVHVTTATTRYAHPVVFGLAWWVPLLFAAAALAIGLPHAGLAARGGAVVPPSGGRVAAGLALLLALWATSGCVKPAWAALAILAPASLAMWWVFDATALGLGLALVTAACGVAVETTLARAGVFAYVAPDAGRVASWLPWLYVAASVAVGNLARWLTRAPSSGSPAVH